MLELYDIYKAYSKNYQKLKCLNVMKCVKHYNGNEYGSSNDVESPEVLRSASDNTKYTHILATPIRIMMSLSLTQQI